MRYALVDQNGLVAHVVLWDGVEPTPPVYDDETGQVIEPARGWAPPEGLTAVALADDHPAGPGDTLDPATLEVAVPAPPPAVEPTVEDRLAALEAQLGQG